MNKKVFISYKRISKEHVFKIVGEIKLNTGIDCWIDLALPWIYTAIANAKSLFRDMYHGIKKVFLQEYLNGFCYKNYRRNFGDRVFGKVVIAAVSYKPTFEHRMYGSVSSKCG